MNQNFVPYQAIIADPDPDTRMRLLSATTTVNLFGDVRQVKNLRESMQVLRTSSECDVVFVSHRFDDSAIDTFMSEARTSEQGKYCAYILVLRGSDQNSPVVARHLTLGMDGFLFEPYSVNSLVEITEIASKVRQERSLAREQLAMTLLLTDIIGQLDVVAALQACELELGPSLKELKRLGAALRQFDGESLERYFELAVRLFSEAPLPKKMVKVNSYAGVSRRVKKRLEERLVQELENEKRELANELASGKYRVIRRKV